MGLVFSFAYAALFGTHTLATQCINCQACAAFAPETFQRDDRILQHVVYRQPETEAELAKARTALAACPVAAIRLESLAERRHRATTDTAKAQVEQSWTAADERILEHMSLKRNDRPSPFPRPLFLDETNESIEPVPDVYWVGHHNEASFGATPFLVRAQHKNESVWIMVDTPRYSAAAVEDVLSVVMTEGAKKNNNDKTNGPHYLFLTHVDDTADHGKWAERFPQMRQIFHAGDLGRHNWIGDRTLEDVDILLPKVERKGDDVNANLLTAYSLDGQVLPSDWKEQWEAGSILHDSDVVILHTPGHSPGSITLYKRPSRSDESASHHRSPGIIFTGDTYAYTNAQGGKMTGFGRYGNNLEQQASTLTKLINLDWDIVAAGHGLSRDYRGVDRPVKVDELEIALNDLVGRRLSLAGR